MWWLWKHRQAWRELKTFWEHRVLLYRFLGDVNTVCNLGMNVSDKTIKNIGDRASHHVEWMKKCDAEEVPRLVSVPLAREWKIVAPPAPPMPRGGDRVPLLSPVPPPPPKRG